MSPIEHMVGWAPYPPSQGPKSIRYRVFAKFVLGDRIEGPFNTIIEYPIAKPGPIQGWVIEDASVVDRLQFGAPVRLEGRLEQHGHDLAISSELAGIHNWYRGAFGSTGVVCHFQCDDLTIDERFGPIADNDISSRRAVAYRLKGPIELFGGVPERSVQQRAAD